MPPTADTWVVPDQLWMIPSAMPVVRSVEGGLIAVRDDSSKLLPGGLRTGAGRAIGNAVARPALGCLSASTTTIWRHLLQLANFQRDATISYTDPICHPIARGQL
jgi:hypothetical protein